MWVGGLLSLRKLLMAPVPCPPCVLACLCAAPAAMALPGPPTHPPTHTHTRPHIILSILSHAMQVVARSRADIMAARGVKPTLSPNLNVLATVEALMPDVKRLLFIGVGCQVGSRQ